jgi:hypothetical protein
VRTKRLVASEKRGFDVSEIGEQQFGSFNYSEHVFDKTGDKQVFFDLNYFRLN